MAHQLRHGRVLRILRMVFGSSRVNPSRARRQFERVRAGGAGRGGRTSRGIPSWGLGRPPGSGQRVGLGEDPRRSSRKFFRGGEGIPWREDVLYGAQLFSMAISLRVPLGGREDFVSTEIAVEDCLLSQRMPSSVAVPTVIRVPALIEGSASLRTLLPEEPVLVGVQSSLWDQPS